MKKYKRLSTVMVAVIAMVVMFTMPYTVQAQSSEISVELNGSRIAFDQPPVIQDGRTLVPLRAIFEAMGATVEWEQQTRMVTSTLDGVTISLAVNSTQLIRNGEVITLDVPAQLVANRTLVPVRAIAESFGADVQWNQATRTVYITTDVSNIPQGQQAPQQAPQPLQGQQTLQQTPEDARFIGNVNSDIFHRLGCHRLPAPQNRIYFETREQAISAGHTPCQICNP